MQPINLIKRADVQRRLGVSRGFIYDRLSIKSPRYDPNFPKPISLGGVRTVGFIESEVDAYIAALLESSRTSPGSEKLLTPEGENIDPATTPDPLMKLADEALEWFKQTHIVDQLDTSTWERFIAKFQPVEDQMVQDATTIDSAGEQSRVAGDAATGVGQMVS